MSWFVPLIADAEAGFGGALNAFELMKAMIEAGAACVHFEDQLSSAKKCGHLGGKVLVPTQEAVQKLVAARLAADVLGVPTLVLARTDANSAQEEGIVARVREMLPVLEEADDPHGLVRAWRLLYYAHGTAARWGLAAEAAQQTIRHAEQAGEELMARRFAGMLANSVLYGPTPVDEAIAYCEREGIAYQVFESTPPKRARVSYSDNFAAGRRGAWTH